jgi:hypothetical protein
MVIFLLIKKVTSFGLGILDLIHQEAGILQEKPGDLFKVLQAILVIGIGMLVLLHQLRRQKWIIMEDKV